MENVFLQLSVCDSLCGMMHVQADTLSHLLLKVSIFFLKIRLSRGGPTSLIRLESQWFSIHQCDVETAHTLRVNCSETCVMKNISIVCSGIFNKRGIVMITIIIIRRRRMKIMPVCSFWLRQMFERRGWRNGQCCILRLGHGREPSMQCVSSQQGSSKGRTVSWLCIATQSGLRGEEGGGRGDGQIPAVLLQWFDLKIVKLCYVFTASVQICIGERCSHVDDRMCPKQILG